MDKFEIEISKKLEALKSDVVDKDWERFSKKFPIEKKSVLKLAFQNIYRIAAVILITSLISLAGVQYFIFTNLNKQLDSLKLQNSKLITENKNLESKIETIEAIIAEEINVEQNSKEELLGNKSVNEVLKSNKESFKNKKISAPKANLKAKAKIKFFQKIKMAINKVFSYKKDSTSKIKK